MKYIVITSKHHDGFALFDSKVEPLRRGGRDAVQARHPEGAGRGLREARACRSASTTRRRRTGTSRTAPATPGTSAPTSKKDYDKYLRGKAEPQVRELLTGYGPVALIWFDTPRMMTRRARAALHRHRAHAAAEDADRRPARRRGRLRHDRRQRDPAARSRPTAWEVPATLNHTWGYRKDDHDWKSPGDVTFKLVDIVSKGGNYLLNVGPMADGVIPQPSQDVLRDGRALAEDERRGRLRRGRDARGATSSASRARRAPRTCAASRSFLPRNEWRVTTKPGKLYFTFFEEPRVPFELPPMKNAVKRAYRLADAQPIEVKAEGGRPSARDRAPDPRSDGHRRRRRDRRRRRPEVTGRRGHRRMRLERRRKPRGVRLSSGALLRAASRGGGACQRPRRCSLQWNELAPGVWEARVGEPERLTLLGAAGAGAEARRRSRTLPRAGFPFEPGEAVARVASRQGRAALPAGARRGGLRARRRLQVAAPHGLGVPAARRPLGRRARAHARAGAVLRLEPRLRRPHRRGALRRPLRRRGGAARGADASRRSSTARRAARRGRRMPRSDSVEALVPAPGARMSTSSPARRRWTPSAATTSSAAAARCRRSGGSAS